jgi:hypothetical protein
LTQPFFQDGVIAQSANQVARDRNIPYFSSAGNQAANSWEGAFAPSTVVSDGCTFHDFGGNDIRQSVTLTTARARIVLQWDDPYFTVSGVPGAARDVNLFLVQGGTVVRSDVLNNVGGDPVAFIEAPSAGVYDIQISLCQGTAPARMKWIIFGGVNNIEYDTMSSTSFGHPNQPFTAGVGAAFFQRTPRFGINPPALETFSSRGGTPILFDTNGVRKSTPEIRMQPRFVATDGNINTFFGQQLNFVPNGLGFYFFGAFHEFSFVRLLQKQMIKLIFNVSFC